MEEMTLAYRYEITGEGLRAVNVLTGEVLKLAKAEELATERAKELIDALSGARGLGGGGGGTSPSPTGSPPPAAAIPADLDSGISERLARAIESLTGEMRQLPELIRLGVRDGLGNPTVAGTGGVADGFEPDGSMRRRPAGRGADTDEVGDDAAGRAKRKKEQQGFDRRVMAGIGMAAAGLDIGARVAQVDATPFMDSSDRFWRTARQFNIPGTNIGIGGLRDIQLWMQRHGKGIDPDEEERKNLGINRFDEIVRRPFEAFSLDWGQRVSALNRQVQVAYGFAADPGAVPGPSRPPVHPGPAPGTRENPITGPGQEGAYRERLRMYEQDKLAYDQAEVRRREVRATERFAPQMPLADLPSLNRETVGAQQRYEEMMARLAGRDRQVEAQRAEAVSRAELVGVESRYADTEKRIREANARIRELDDLIEKAAGANDGGASATTLKARRADAAKDLYGATQQFRELDDRKLRLGEDVARSRAGVREADTQMKRIELMQAQQQEATARSQAVRLTELGPAGRAQALAVAELEREAGYENLPAELRAMFQSAFPETARKKGEAAGQQFFDEFKAVAPDEFRESVGASREVVNQLLQAVRKSEQESPGLLFKDILEVTRSTASRLDRYWADLQAFIKQYKEESRQKNNESGG